MIRYSVIGGKEPVTFVTGSADAHRRGGIRTLRGIALDPAEGRQIGGVSLVDRDVTPVTR